jgi:hypothetical protein
VARALRNVWSTSSGFPKSKCKFLSDDVLKGESQ